MLKWYFFSGDVYAENAYVSELGKAKLLAAGIDPDDITRVGFIKAMKGLMRKRRQKKGENKEK